MPGPKQRLRGCNVAPLFVGRCSTEAKHMSSIGVRKLVGMDGKPFSYTACNMLCRCSYGVTCCRASPMRIHYHVYKPPCVDADMVPHVVESTNQTRACTVPCVYSPMRVHHHVYTSPCLCTTMRTQTHSYIQPCVHAAMRVHLPA